MHKKFFLKSLLLLAISAVTCIGVASLRSAGGIVSAQSGVTQGSLQVVDPTGKPKAICPLKHTDVKASVSGPLARVTVTQEPWDAVLAVQGLVNATPIGMAKMPGSPIRADLLRPSLWVADVIYFPAETELLRAARRLGCRTMNGGSMAVFQAVQAFHAFTGRRADADRVHRHFRELCDRVA